MPYTSEAEIAAAVTAYRALHEVFYRLQKSVHRHAHDEAPPPEAVAACDDDYRALTERLLPAMAAAMRNDDHYVTRLVRTFEQLGARRAQASPPRFDWPLTFDAYIDVDNILQHLLRQREHFPRAFDDAFVGIQAVNAQALVPRRGV